METTVPDAPLEATPGVPDDIADPPVPAAALAPLPPDPLADLRSDVRAALAVMDAMCRVVDTRLGTLAPAEAGALQHLCDALDGLKSGLVVSGAPYKLAMQAITPHGFPVTLTVERQDGATFFAALASMATWLQENGYTLPPVAIPV